MYTNKTKNIIGSWYAPQGFLKSLKRTIQVELWDTTSSDGDWNGYFITKAQKKYCLIPFSQENNYPNTGYTLYTGSCIESWDNMPTPEVLESRIAIYDEYGQ